MVEEFVATVGNSNTKSTYRRYAQRFVDWLGEDKLQDLAPADVLAYMAYLQDEGYAESSISLQVTAVREFLRWASLVGRVSPTVYASARAVKGVKVPKTLPEIFSEQDIEHLLAQPNINTVGGARDYAFIHFALSTGARVSEMVALNIEDLRFDDDGGEVVVWGKGSKERAVFFDKDTAAALVYYFGLRGSPSSGPLFVNESDGRISARGIQKMLHTIGTAAGVEAHPHKFRHTFATWMLDACGDIHAVGTLLGHANLKTTQRYTGLATGRLRGVYNAYQAVRTSGGENGKSYDSGKCFSPSGAGVRDRERCAVGVS